MVLTLKEKEHSELQKKMSKENAKISSDIAMFGVSSTVTVIGVYVSYFAYLKLGITSLLNLCVFILGITLSVSGLERVFDSLGSIIEKRTHLYLDASAYDRKAWKCVNPLICSDTISIEEDCVSRTSTYTDVNKSKLPVTPLTYNWEWLRVCVFPRESSIILVSEDPVFTGCMCLSDGYDGFDYDKCLEEIKSHVKDDRINEFDSTYSCEYVFILADGGKLSEFLESI